MSTSSTPDAPFAGLPAWLCRLWAGLECGVLAGIFVLLWFVFHSLLRTEFWWAKLNIAAMPFYDAAVFSAGPGYASAAGAALIVLAHCLAGILFGAAAVFQPRRRTALFAAAFVLAWHLAAARFVWPGLDPQARLWFPLSATGPASLIQFGALLRFQPLLAKITALFGRSADDGM